MKLHTGCDMNEIECISMSVHYKVYNNEAKSIRRKILNVSTGGIISRESNGSAVVKALDEIDLLFKEGDRIGLVGHNGAGKTTLLRVLAGIYKPTGGSIRINGNVSTLFGLGGGLDQDLSGYENINRMCAISGIKTSNWSRIKKDVEEFTELGEFLKMPVRTYSAGMGVRLMFAVATSTNPEILLIDEVFGVGDVNFQEKAKSRMENLLKNAGIVVLSTHADDVITKYCNEKLTLEHGSIVSRTRIG